MLFVFMLFEWEMQCLSAVLYVVRTWYGLLRQWRNHRRGSPVIDSLLIIM